MEGPSEQQVLTLEQVAGRLGVHYMTVYRYLRLGQLTAQKREGRWLVSPHEVDRLLARAKRPSRSHDHRGSENRERLLARMLAGDSAGSWAIIEAALAASSAARVYVELLGPALRQLGDGWAAGTISIGEEHRATAVALGAIGRLGPLFARPGRRRPGRVIMAGAARDFHVIPLTMVCDVLRGEGFSVIDLGASVPRSTLLETIATAPQVTAVGISVSVDRDGRHVVGDIAAIRRARPDLAVLVGGPAVPDRATAMELGADHWAADATAAAALMVGLDRRARHLPGIRVPPRGPSGQG